MGLTIIVTNAGRAALVNATNTGTDPVTIAQVGLSATAVAPSPAATTLPDEFKRLATLSGDVVADDTIHLIVRDEGVDVFTVRSLALYLADGTLFAIYGQADVLVEKSASATMLIAIDVKFEDVDATDLTFGDANFLNPPATTEQQGVVELATTAEAQAGIDALRALTPAAAKAAILGWLLAMDGAGSGLDADLLDGQQGSYYTNIVARLGYTPLDKAGDTMTGGFVSVAPAAGGAGFRLPHGTAPSSPVNGDFWSTTGGLFGRINGVTQQLVTFSNDGAGSGLDADLLDGQHGSYYNDLANSTGTLPNARFSGAYDGITLLTAQRVRLTNTSDASPTSTLHAFQIGPDDGANLIIDGNEIMGRNNGVGVQVYYEFGINIGAVSLLTAGGAAFWHPSNDGAGSGLDADLLDGQQGSYYTNIIARLGYTPLDATDYTASDVKAKLLTVDGAGSGVDADLLDGQHGSYYLPASSYSAADVKAKLLTVDGPGSGINADLLDGLHAAAFALLADFTGSNQSLAANGFQKLPGGMIIQWGTITATANVTTTITYPIAFSSTSRCVVSGGYADANRQDNPPDVTGTTATTASVFNANDITVTAWWIAVGW